MSLGQCRHCESRGVAVDAPICKYCGGWMPNPNFFSRMWVFCNRIGCLIFLAAPALMFFYFGGFHPEQNGLWFLAGLMALMSACELFRSLIRPYGRPYIDQ